MAIAIKKYRRTCSAVANGIPRYFDDDHLASTSALGVVTDIFDRLISNKVEEL